MIISSKGVLVASFLLVPIPGLAQAAQQSAAQIPVVTDIRLSYKLDPRVADPFRGLGPWVSGPNYAGATAQDTVEVRAEGVDSTGRPVAISPEWIPSDPEMVTVEPSQGNHVKITVHRAGESKLNMNYQGLSREFVVRAKYLGELMAFGIEQPGAAKPRLPAPETTGPFKDKKEQVSYAAGMNLGKALQKQFTELNEDLVAQGFKDTMSRSKTLMTEEQAQAALSGVQTDDRLIKANLDRKALAEKNKREGAAFLAVNRKKKGVVGLPSGLQYKVIKASAGKKPAADDLVTCRYRATFVDGTELENTRDGSVTFPVKSVVKGLAEALQLMAVGSKWQVFVPPELAYGERGGGVNGGRRVGPRRQVIGPNTTLIFEVELLSIQEGSSAKTLVSTGQKPNTTRTERQKEALR